MEGPAIGGGGGRCRAYGENLQGAYPIEGELDLANGGVGAFLGNLADGGSGVVDQRPTGDGKRRRSEQNVHDGGVVVVETRYVDGVELLDGTVGALLTGSGEIDI